MAVFVSGWGGARPLAQARPISVSLEDSATFPAMTVMAASTDAQVSSGYQSQKHGLFTFFLLMGFKGEADANGDRAVTAEELGKYVQHRVEAEALEVHDRVQTPTITTDRPDQVLVRFP